MKVKPICKLLFYLSLIIYYCSCNNQNNNKTLNQGKIKSDTVPSINNLHTKVVPTIYIDQLEQKKGMLESNDKDKVRYKKDTFFIGKNVFAVFPLTDSTDIFDEYSMRLYNNKNIIFSKDHIYSYSSFEYMPEKELLTFIIDTVASEHITTTNLYLVNLKTNLIRVIDHPDGLGDAPFYNNGENVLYINGYSLYTYNISDKTKIEVAKVDFNESGGNYPSPQLLNIDISNNNKISLSFYKNSDTQDTSYIIKFNLPGITK